MVYGPNVEYDLKEWMIKLGVINKKEWVKNFMLNEKHDYEFYAGISGEFE